MSHVESLHTGSLRKVERILTSRTTIEGAGVRVKRAFVDDTLLEAFEN
jgi:hypothetical protein